MRVWPIVCVLKKQEDWKGKVLKNNTKLVVRNWKNKKY